jgi:hypothetical protein
VSDRLQADLVSFVAKALSGGAEWRYLFWGTDTEGVEQVFKAWGDGDGLYNASVEAWSAYTGWEGILWGKGGCGLSDDAQELGEKLKRYRLIDLSWDRQL